ncbi:hypothetical protein GEMRC1_012608 [Eukaryota sp. GEM-RC1]
MYSNFTDVEFLKNDRLGPTGNPIPSDDESTEPIIEVSTISVSPTPLTVFYSSSGEEPEELSIAAFTSVPIMFDSSSDDEELLF